MLINHISNLVRLILGGNIVFVNVLTKCAEQNTAKLITMNTRKRVFCRLLETDSLYLTQNNMSRIGTDFPELFRGIKT